MATRNPNRNAEQWADLIRQFSEGHEPESDFCQRLAINRLTFRKHRYAANAARKRADSAFVPVSVARPAVERACMQLHLPGDVRIELTRSADMGSVAELVKALHHER